MQYFSAQILRPHQIKIHPVLEVYLMMLGARGSIVVKTLCYKLESQGFKTR
jgi:hypothetical protein